MELQIKDMKLGISNGLFKTNDTLVYSFNGGYIYVKDSCFLYRAILCIEFICFEFIVSKTLVAVNY